jgi:hypothetical protein
VARTGDRYGLHAELVSVDYWDFLVAATDLTSPDPATRRTACDAAVTTYGGPPAADHAGEWLLTLREATRRRYLDALTSLARLTIADDPERTLGLLETARNLEPLNEALYRDIIRIQHRLGRPDAAALTLELLSVRSWPTSTRHPTPPPSPSRTTATYPRHPSSRTRPAVLFPGASALVLAGTFPARTNGSSWARSTPQMGVDLLHAHAACGRCSLSHPQVPRSGTDLITLAYVIKFDRPGGRGVVARSRCASARGRACEDPGRCRCGGGRRRARRRRTPDRSRRCVDNSALARAPPR